MNTYDFTLKFTLPAEESVSDMDVLVERLGEAGCDDALVGIGKTGRLALNFAREADTALEAISSAIINVKNAIPNAKLVEASPDLVGLTDVADIIGCSRQNIRKIMLSNGASFPAPVHDGKSALWHLASVLNWLQESRSYAVAGSLVEVAATTMQVNLARDAGRLDKTLQKELTPLLG